MERDFEREFRELKQNEIPDLWNRIEAGLSEKNDFVKENTKKPYAWRKWGTLIAACVCVVIILPAFSLLIRDKSYSGSGSDTAANTTEAIAEDNAAAMDTATAENAECGFAADEAAAENKTADMAAGNTQTQGADRADASGKEEEKAVWDDLADGQILEEVVIRIQKAETADGEALYQAAVEQADADNILESGTQIALVCNGDTEYELLRGPRDEKELEKRAAYLVTLRYDAESGRFTVLKAESWEG